MIDTTVYVRCDAAVGDELCEAEFEMEGYGTAVDPLRLAHQLRQRGWITKRRSKGTPQYLTLCPLHAPTEDSDHE